MAAPESLTQPSPSISLTCSVAGTGEAGHGLSCDNFFVSKE